MSAVKGLVDQLIAKHSLLVFSKTYCPYCTRAKSAAKDLTTIEVVELDERDDGSDIQDYLKTLTKQSTVPNIFVKGKHIGGCDDFLKAVSDGSIAKLLNA